MPSALLADGVHADELLMLMAALSYAPKGALPRCWHVGPTVMAVDVSADHRGIDLHVVDRLATAVERRASTSREPAADHLCGESCLGGIAVLLADSVRNADIARDAK